MGGVDKHDRLVLVCETDRRSKFRFYFRLNFNFFDQVIVNSRITWNTIHPDSKVSAKDFRYSVAEGIVAGFSSRSRQTSSNKQKTAAPQDAHIPGLTTRRRCVICYQKS